jgi:CRP/FNR family transcriptional regulator, cyclic AMP receptor protein
MPLLFIKQIPLFAPLSTLDHERLASLMRRRFIRKGDFLFHKGDEGTALYIIIEGLIKIAVPAKRGDEITLAMLTEGDFFGEMALLDDLPRSADAAALEDTQLYMLNRNDFLSFLMQNEHSVRAIFHALSLRLRRTDDLVAEVCFLNVSARLAKRLIDLVETQHQADRGSGPYEVNLTQRQLASLTGVARETINKEIKILRQKGIVSTSRKTITICDLERLRNRIR